MNIRRLVVGLVIGLTTGVFATHVPAQTNENGQSRQAENQDPRYFVYMRGIT